MFQMPQVYPKWRFERHKARYDSFLGEKGGGDEAARHDSDVLSSSLLHQTPQWRMIACGMTSTASGSPWFPASCPSTRHAGWVAATVEPLFKASSLPRLNCSCAASFVSEYAIGFMPILYGDAFWTPSPTLVSWAHYHVVRSFCALHCDVTIVSLASQMGHQEALSLACWSQKRHIGIVIFFVTRFFYLWIYPFLLLLITYCSSLEKYVSPQKKVRFSYTDW